MYKTKRFKFSDYQQGGDIGVGAILGNVTGVASGIKGLADDTKTNDGTATGQMVGSALDTAAMAFGIPTFGALGKIGSGVGSMFNPEEKEKRYMPSGNTSGRWKEFKSGGNLLPLSKKYSSLIKKQQGGYYGKYPMSTSRKGERSNYEIYYEPGKDKYLDKLNEQYDFPEKFLQAVSLKESGRGYIDNGKPTFRINEQAESHADAQGPFQFRAATGKEYGLENKGDRQDFYKSALASAKKYSKDRKKYGSLPKAMMAYNWGSGNVRAYDKGKKNIPKETEYYLKRINDLQEQMSYPNSLERQSSIPVVTAPRATSSEIQSGNVSSVPQYSKNTKFPYTKGAGMLPYVDYKMQQGGNTDPRASIEIEGGEYVFNPKGVDDNTFKMLDSTGKSNKSKFGFLAEGKKHAKDNSAGIKVMEGDAYIASSHLGMNGKKSGKGNPSVASMMLKNGGKALSQGYENKWDRRGINNWNPGAVKHHLNMMNNVKNKAEINKFKQNIKSGNKMRSGGIITPSNTLLNPSPSSYASGIKEGMRESNKLGNEVKQLYKDRMDAYNPEYKVLKSGGKTKPLSFKEYQMYYQSLPHSKKIEIANRLKKVNKLQMGGELKNILNDMYSNESLIANNGSEGL